MSRTSQGALSAGAPLGRPAAGPGVPAHPPGARSNAEQMAGGGAGRGARAAAAGPD